MISTRFDAKTHPSAIELANYLDNTLLKERRLLVEDHIAACGSCLADIVSAHDSIKHYRRSSADGTAIRQKRRRITLHTSNPYLVLAIISFALSFFLPQYFIQLLVATLLLGLKWIVDSKTTRMLVMIHEAWKKGGEKETTRIMRQFDQDIHTRI